MGFFSDIGDAIFGGGGGGDGGFWQDVIGIGGDIAGAIIGGDAIDSAAKQAKKGQKAALEFQRQQTERAIQLFQEARDAGLQDLDRQHLAALEALGIGADQARALYQEIRTQTAPSVDYLGRVVAANPAELTPSQKIGLEDLTRQLDASLAASGLRGAGRAGQAVKADATRRYVADAIKQNQDRIDNTARTLASQNFAATGNEAGLAAQTGSQIAQTETQHGSNEANLRTGAATSAGNVISTGAQSGANRLGDIGDINANASLAGGQLWSSTLGDLASIFANATKDDKTGRDSTATIDPVYSPPFKGPAGYQPAWT